MLDNKHNREKKQKSEVDPCEFTAAFIRGALLLQEKWVMMIVFSLLSEPISFSELMRRGNVNTTTLTQRLNLLEEAGLLVKTVHSAMPPRTSYALTEAGLALRPVLQAIMDWSGKYLPTLKEIPDLQEAQECPSTEKKAHQTCVPAPPAN